MLAVTTLPASSEARRQCESALFWTQQAFLRHCGYFPAPAQWLLEDLVVPVIEKDAYSTCVYFTKNGQREGLYERFYVNGQLYERCTYKNGRREGVCESFHENGQLLERCAYKNGKQEGLCESFHENGQLMERCTYKNGELDGLCESFYENWQVVVRCTYKNGEQGLFETREWATL